MIVQHPKADTIYKTHSEFSVADIHRIKLKAETFKVMEANIEMLLHASNNSFFFFIHPSKACEKDIMTKITTYQIVHLSCTEMGRISREQLCFDISIVFAILAFIFVGWLFLFFCSLLLFHWNPPIIIGSTQFTKYYNLKPK